MSVQKLQQSENHPNYRVLHQLTEKEKQEGSIFVKTDKKISVTYKDFNGDGFITENEVYKIENYSSYKSANENQITVIEQRIDDNGDGKLDMHTRTRLRNGKEVLDTRKLPLEWGSKLIEDARVAWIKEIEFTENDF